MWRLLLYKGRSDVIATEHYQCEGTKQRSDWRHQAVKDRYDPSETVVPPLEQVQTAQAVQNRDKRKNQIHDHGGPHHHPQGHVPAVPCVVVFSPYRVKHVTESKCRKHEPDDSHDA
jgi:hypothetical protein